MMARAITPAASIAALRLRIAGLAADRRDAYLQDLEAVLALPEGKERDSGLRRLSARTLRAEALARHPRMVRG